MSYDALDRPLDIALGGDAATPVMTAARRYDAVSGRLDHLEAVVAGQTLGEADYGIDGAGRVRTIDYATRPVGGGALEPESLVAGYDGLDRLVSASQATFAYDALGNVTRKDVVPGDPVGFATLSYQDALRPHALTQAVSPLGDRSLSYVYDAGGNVHRKQRVDDPAGEGSRW